jgi:hypothetical protein
MGHPKLRPHEFVALRGKEAGLSRRQAPPWEVLGCLLLVL